MRQLSLGCLLVVLIITGIASPVKAGDIITCSPEDVREWIGDYKTFLDAFDAADLTLSDNLRDFRRIPRVDLLIDAQEVWTDFASASHPTCAEKLYVNTLLYWTRRTNHLIEALDTGERPDTQTAEAAFYENVVLPSIYQLEADTGIDYFEVLGQTRPEGAPPAPTTSVRVGEIIVTNNQLGNIIAVEPVTLPNCNGSSDLTLTRTFSKSSERRVSVSEESSAGVLAGPVFAQAIVQIDKEIGSEETEVISEAIELAMTAAPGSTVTYEIEWVEMSTAGIVEIVIEDHTEFIEFSVANALRANIREPIQSPCDS